jgi:hypothetical protein
MSDRLIIRWLITFFTLCALVAAAAIWVGDDYQAFLKEWTF